MEGIVLLVLSLCRRPAHDIGGWGNVQYMLDNHIAVQSSSSWSSPSLLVGKSNRSPRFATINIRLIWSWRWIPICHCRGRTVWVGSAKFVSKWHFFVGSFDFLKKCNSHQLSYSTNNKEALALVCALQHFEVYVGSGGGPVMIYTDRNPLAFLCSLSCPNRCLMRWTMFLQSHGLDIRHIQGMGNLHVADALTFLLTP